MVVDELSVASGGLGWRVSVGALILAKWMAHHVHVLRNKSVLEVGSGLGVAGLVAGAVGARRVCLSDVLPDLLCNLDRAVGMNASRGHVDAARFDVRRLDLGASALGSGRRARTHLTMEEKVLLDNAGAEVTASAMSDVDDDEVFDVILAAEACYEEYHADALAATIARHLSKDPAGVAILVQAVRDTGVMVRGGLLARLVTKANALGLSVHVSTIRTASAPPLSLRLDPGRWSHARVAEELAALAPAAPAPMALIRISWAEPP